MPVTVHASSLSVTSRWTLRDGPISRRNSISFSRVHMGPAGTISNTKSAATTIRSATFDGRSGEIWSFLDLAADGRVELPSKLTTHRFPIERAGEAYDVVTGKTEAFSIGVLLDFGASGSAPLQPAAPAVKGAVSGRIGLGIIGTGQFAKGVLLPAIVGTSAFDVIGVASARGLCEKRRRPLRCEVCRQQRDADPRRSCRSIRCHCDGTTATRSSSSKRSGATSTCLSRNRCVCGPRIWTLSKTLRNARREHFLSASIGDLAQWCGPFARISPGGASPWP